MKDSKKYDKKCKLDTKVPKPGSKEGMSPNRARRVTPIVKNNLTKPVKKK
jgi:hypothetical protein